MTVYVGRDVNIVEQIPVSLPISHKVIQRMDYSSVYQSQTGSHEAYHHSASSEPNPPFGSELTDSEYDQIEKSDDVRFSKSTTVNGEYAVMLFRYKCDFPEADVKKIVIQFEGYGTAPAGNGATMKVWDHVSSAWSNEVSGTSGADEVLTITLTANLGNYIDDDGYIWVLVRTTNPSDGTTAATLYCDFAMCYVTRAKITLDHYPISDRDMDGVADETTHVTVKVNGSEVTVSSVDDDTGEVTLASADFNVDDYVTVEYRHDRTPFVAQEVTIEPRQRIEGLDGLGSDEIQQWAVLLKEISGSIKEVYQPGSLDQLSLLMPLNVRMESFSDDDDWEVVSGNWTIENGTYKGNSSGEAISTWKNSAYDDGILEVKFKTSNAAAILLRYNNTQNYYKLEVNVNEKIIRFVRRIPAGSTILAETRVSSITANTWHRVKVYFFKTANGNEFHVYLDCGEGYKYVFSTSDSTFSTGRICLWLWNSTSYFDDIKIHDPSCSDSNQTAGLIIIYDQNGQAVKIGLDGVIFPEGSLPVPKNEPVYIVTPFKAQSIKVIT